MEVTFRVEGPPILKDNTDLSRILDNMLKKTSDQLKEQVALALSSSIDLVTLAGQAPDPEVVRTIMRSVRVKPSNSPYTNISIEFGDEYAHLYGGKVDDTIKAIITDLVDKAIKSWFNSPQATSMFAEAILGKI